MRVSLLHSVVWDCLRQKSPRRPVTGRYVQGSSTFVGGREFIKMGTTQKGRDDRLELHCKNLEASNFPSASTEKKGSLVLNQHINAFRSLILNPVNNFICTASVEKGCDTNHQKQLTDCHERFSSEESSLLHLNTSLTCNNTMVMVEGDFSTHTFYSNLRGTHSQLRNTPCLPHTQVAQIDTGDGFLLGVIGNKF